MNGVRLLACGQLQLTMDEALVFADALRPAFDDAGIALEITTPDRWHLRLAAEYLAADVLGARAGVG